LMLMGHVRLEAHAGDRFLRDGEFLVSVGLPTRKRGTVRGFRFGGALTGENWRDGGRPREVRVLVEVESDRPGRLP